VYPPQEYVTVEVRWLSSRRGKVYFLWGRRKTVQDNIRSQTFGSDLLPMKMERGMIRP
jgi:hypothetical protein